jgi:hypothetical protein
MIFFCAQFRIFLDDWLEKLYCLNFRNFLLHHANGESWYRVLVCTVGGQKASAVLPNTSAVGMSWPLLVGWLLKGPGSVTPLSKTCSLENIRCFRHFWTSVKRTEDAWYVRIAWLLSQPASSSQPGTRSTPVSEWASRWTSDESWFDFRRRRKVYVFWKASKPTLWPFQLVQGITLSWREADPLILYTLPVIRINGALPPLSHMLS